MKIEVYPNENRTESLTCDNVRSFLNDTLGIPLQPDHIEGQLDGTFSVEFNIDDILYFDESHTSHIRDGQHLEVPASLGFPHINN